MSSITRYLTGSSNRAGLLIVGGVVLFVLPEPMTSVLGALLVLAGIVVWLVG